MKLTRVKIIYFLLDIHSTFHIWSSFPVVDIVYNINN